MSSKINRRSFVAGAAGAVSAAFTSGSASQASASDKLKALPGQGHRAAILEFRDRWTKQSTGLGNCWARRA